MKKLAVCLSLAMSLVSSNLIYPETAKIVDIDYSTEAVTVECFNGNQFQFFGAEDYAINDIVSMLMFSNGTRLVKDDIILSCKYSGYIE